MEISLPSGASCRHPVDVADSSSTDASSRTDASDEDDYLSRLWQLGPAMVLGAPHSKRLGIRFVSVGLGGEGVRGRASLALDYRRDLVGDARARVLHGGAVTTLLDQTCGFAAIAGFRRPVSVATLNLHIDYQRASPPNRTVIAVAEAYKITQHVAFLRGIAHNGDEADPVARCQASFIVNTASVDAAMERSRV